MMQLISHQTILRLSVIALLAVTGVILLSGCTTKKATTIELTDEDRRRIAVENEIWLEDQGIRKRAMTEQEEIELRETYRGMLHEKYSYIDSTEEERLRIQAEGGGF